MPSYKKFLMKQCLIFNQNEKININPVIKTAVIHSGGMENQNEVWGRFSK